MSDAVWSGDSRLKAGLVSLVVTANQANALEEAPEGALRSGSGLDPTRAASALGVVQMALNMAGGAAK